MSKEPLPQSIADLPAQRARSPNSKAEARARYFNTGNAFNLQLPRVPDESFTAEPAKALHQDTPTGLVACDRSKELGCAFPAAALSDCEGSATTGAGAESARSSGCSRSSCRTLPSAPHRR